MKPLLFIAGSCADDDDFYDEIQEGYLSLSRAAAAQGYDLLMRDQPEVSGMVAAVVGSESDSMQLLLHGEDDEIIQDIGHGRIQLRDGDLFAGVTPAAMVVIGGDEQTRTDAAEFMRRFPAAPVLLLRQSGGLAAEMAADGKGQILEKAWEKVLPGQEPTPTACMQHGLEELGLPASGGLGGTSGGGIGL